MINAVRLNAIRQLLSKAHKVHVLDLAQKFEVAEETIRRDLKYLEEAGELRRVYGGAILASLDEEQPLTIRTKIKPKEKIKIAHLALQLIDHGMSIFLDTGTTTLALAHQLHQFNNLKVITNSLDIASALAKLGNAEVYLLPGKLRANDNAIIGEQALVHVGQYNYDLAFMGIGAIDIHKGFVDYSEAEALIRRELLKYSKQKIIIADDSKFNTKGFFNTFGFEGIDILVTNKKPSAQQIQVLEQHHVRIIY
jgi:DeoR family glycerol-3-phosphate regulon repressor